MKNIKAIDILMILMLCLLLTVVFVRDPRGLFKLRANHELIEVEDRVRVTADEIMTVKDDVIEIDTTNMYADTMLFFKPFDDLDVELIGIYGDGQPQIMFNLCSVDYKESDGYFIKYGAYAKCKHCGGSIPHFALWYESNPIHAIQIEDKSFNPDTKVVTIDKAKLRKQYEELMKD